MQVYVRRELTRDDVVAAALAGYVVEGVDGDGAFITVRREGTTEVLAVLEESSLDMASASTTIWSRSPARTPCTLCAR
ncbi:hypothetical protein [Actinomyces wuliandei]|uniref:hypothetical protein n=1 Tax=Actinomyces wuliandei TaxID=2057743 RepID=UPI000FD99D37|nr:hypothetical protein [Actinomyces wuliandei]